MSSFFALLVAIAGGWVASRQVDSASGDTARGDSGPAVSDIVVSGGANVSAQ